MRGLLTVFSIQLSFFFHLQFLSSTCFSHSVEDSGGGDEMPLFYIGEYEESIGFYQAIEINENSLVYQNKSQYQDIEVHQSKFFGKMLVLDRIIQLTERDADSYNEMMAHIPMFQHPNPKRVLIIGGGDGYVLKEVLKHESVEHVDHVDLDGDVIRTCQQYFPQWGDAWDDPRVQLHITDGAKFVENTADSLYDVIVQDSSDPWWEKADGSTTPLPSSVLYEHEHICNLHRVLKPDGILNIQSESYIVPSNLEGIKTWRNVMAECGFKRSRYGSTSTTSYPMGQIGFLLVEKDPSSTSWQEDIEARYDVMLKQGKDTNFYHPPLQRSAFFLPLWVHKSIYGSRDLSVLGFEESINTRPGECNSA